MKVRDAAVLPTFRITLITSGGGGCHLSDKRQGNNVRCALPHCLSDRPQHIRWSQGILSYEIILSFRLWVTVVGLKRITFFIVVNGTKLGGDAGSALSFRWQTSLVFLSHPLPNYNISCIHFIRCDEMTNLCSVLPEEITFENNICVTNRDFKYISQFVLWQTFRAR